MNSTSKSPATPRSPFFGRGAVFAIFLAVAAVVLVVKLLFFSSPDRSVDLPVALAQEKLGQEAALLPRSIEEPNTLAFGGALQGVEDFVAFAQTSSYWNVMRDVQRGSLEGYEKAPFAPSYAALLKSPKHYRLAGKPLKVRGIMNTWAANKAEKNDAGAEDFFRSWILDGDEGVIVDSLVRPPVNEEGLGRAAVEVSGIFYQVIRYETNVTIKDLFADAGTSLKRANYPRATEQFRDLLEQEPNPILIARYMRSVQPALWDAYSKSADEARAVVQRLVALGDQGAERIMEKVPDQHVVRPAPLFLAKSIRAIDGYESRSSLDRFFGTTGGALTLLAGLGLLVGLFFYFFMKMQKTQDDKLKREREEFWRQVRRNVKGVSPPGDRFRGGPEEPSV